MKKHLLLPVLLFGISLLVFSTCKKNKKEPSCSGNLGECHSVLEAKDYFAFKMGSWWVYEEEHSGARDSVYVTESSIDPNSYQFNIRMYSTYQDYYYHYWPEYYGGPGIPSCSEKDPVDKKCLYVEYTKYQLGGNYLGQSACFFVNYKIGLYDNTGYCGTNNRITVENIFNSYSIAGNSFNKTIEIHELCSSKEGSQPVNFFYSRYVGLVKKELIDSNQVWNLVSYHIEP